MFYFGHERPHGLWLCTVALARTCTVRLSWSVLCWILQCAGPEVQRGYGACDAGPGATRDMGQASDLRFHLPMKVPQHIQGHCSRAKLTTAEVLYAALLCNIVSRILLFGPLEKYDVCHFSEHSNLPVAD